LYLPLDKLQQIAGQPNSSTPDVLLQPPVAATPATPPPPVDLRSRDALRSRDREDRP